MSEASIMSMFNLAPNAGMSFAGQPATPTAGTTGIPGAGPGGNSAPAGTGAPNPGAGTGAPASAGGTGDLGGTGDNKSPLDAFTALWDTAKDDKGNPLPPTNNAVSIAFDPAKMGEALSKVNLASNVPPDLVAKALGGDQQAFIDAMNSVGRNTYMLAAQSAVKLMEDALKKQDANLTSRLPGMVKEHMTSDQLISENPVFSHPGAAPVLTALQKQIQNKHPNATASELQSMAKQYLKGMLDMYSAGETANAAKGSAGNNNGGRSTTQNAGTSTDDWEGFFSAAIPGS